MGINAMLMFAHASEPPQFRTWSGLDVGDVMDLEDTFSRMFLDLNKAARRVRAGQDKKAAAGGEATVTWVLSFNLDNGDLYSRIQGENPNMSAANYAIFKGYLDGSLKSAPGSVKGKQKNK